MFFSIRNWCLLFLQDEIISSVKRKGRYFDVKHQNYGECVRSLAGGGR